ncbi:Clp protease N-terminal domain-containing protein [Streptomyces asoensis]|uniref:Clp protease N-terminal domain-containing protein n=1 Tax=Streptomyces asoensis TaxID=249586 RepID=UPI0033CF7883
MTFERFTVEARKVVVTAQEEARRLQHDLIGTEHILLALLDAPDTAAAKALHRLGYDKETAQADLAAAVEPGTRMTSGHIPFAPGAKKTLDLALGEANQLRHTHIGPEHILLALVAEGESAGARLLAGRIDPVDRIRTEVLASAQQTYAQPTYAPQTPGVGGPQTSQAPQASRGDRGREGQHGSESPQDLARGSRPAGTTAAEDTLAVATALAGAAPVGSHHLLEALMRAENSMAAKVLRDLGVDADAVAAKIDALDPGTTTDANPEEAAARTMEIRLVDDEVQVILRDPETVAIARTVTELSHGPVRGLGPAAGMFVPLWRATDRLLLDLQRVLSPEPGAEPGAGEGEEGDPGTDRVTEAVRAALAPRLRR